MNRFRLLLGALVAGLGISATVGCATLDERQRAWIFQPSDRTWSGGVAAAQGMEDVWLEFDAGQPETVRANQARAPSTTSAPPPAAVRLHGLWLAQPDPRAPILLYLHGARWDVRGSAPRMRRMHALGFSVLAIDYRGFGQSTAELPSEASAVEDARAAWRWLAREYPNRARYVFGHSLGSAIAVDLASQASDVAGLIVEGSFPSMADVVRAQRFGWLPFEPLLTQRFEAGAKIAQVRSPIIVAHGSEDRLIPEALGQALYERAPAPKRWLRIEGGSHHDANARGQSQYREAMRDLFGLGT